MHDVILQIVLALLFRTVVLMIIIRRIGIAHTCEASATWWKITPLVIVVVALDGDGGKNLER